MVQQHAVFWHDSFSAQSRGVKVQQLGEVGAHLDVRTIVVRIALRGHGGSEASGQRGNRIAIGEIVCRTFTVHVWKV